MAGAFLRSPCFVDALCNWLPAAQIDRTVVSFTSALICFMGCTVVCYAVMRLAIITAAINRLVGTRNIPVYIQLHSRLHL